MFWGILTLKCAEMVLQVDSGPEGRSRVPGASAAPLLGNPQGLGSVAPEGTQDPGGGLWGRTKQVWGQATCCAVGRL